MLRSSSLALLFFASLAGCFPLDFLDSDSTPEEEDSKPEADDLVTIGVYDVVVSLESSDCGQGTVTLPASFDFETTLKEDEEQTSIFWDSGAGPKEGVRKANGRSFTFDSSFVVDMRSPETDDDWLPPCRIRRVDGVDGTFDDGRERASFTGTMSFRYEQTEGSDCSDIIGEPAYWGTEAVLGKLPCEAVYEAIGATPAEE